MGGHFIGFCEDTVVDIRESKLELAMLQSIMVYCKDEYSLYTRILAVADFVVMDDQDGGWLD